MESAVNLREEPGRTVAYLRRDGPYAGIPEALGVLMRYVQERRLAPAGPPIGVFYTDPRTVPAAQAQWEVRVPLAQPAAESEPEPGGVGLRTLPPRTLAVTVHVGPYDAVADTYDATQRWVDQHGYTVVGPPEEAYMSPPDTPAAEVRTEIRFPVAMEPVALGE